MEVPVSVKYGDEVYLCVFQKKQENYYHSPLELSTFIGSDNFDQVEASLCV